MIDTKTKVWLANAKDPSRGTYLTLPFDEEELNDALRTIGATPLDEEEEIDDFDRVVSGEPPEQYFVKEWISDYLREEHFNNIFEASDLVDRIESLQDWEGEVLNALIADGEDLEDAIEETEDGDVEFYPNMDLTSLAEQFGDEGLFSNDFLIEHVDWESVGRELESDGYSEVAGGVLRRN